MTSIVKKVVIAAIAPLLVACGRKDDVRIHLIGDSTMADYEENTTQIRGWGEMMSQFVPEGVVIVNHAKPGRSSRSFYDEGRWASVLDTVQNGDYVFIQFAHNDEKDKGADGADGRGTAPQTTYHDYLSKYVLESRAKGAIPVLVQPVVRRFFDGNSVSSKGRHNLSEEPADTALSYTAVMFRVASELAVPVIDMCAKTCDIVEAFGPVESKNNLFVSADNTHTSAKGAAIFALAAVEAVDTLDVWRGKLPSRAIVANPLSCNFGDVATGDTVSQCIDVVNMDGLSTLSPRYFFKETDFYITAPSGFVLSHSLDGPKKDTLVVKGQDWCNFYVHFSPSALKQSGKVEIASASGHKAYVRVVGSHNQSVSASPFSMSWKSVSSQVDTKEMEAKLSRVMGMQRTNDDAFAVDGGVWPDEIDENSARYVQLKLTAKSRDVKINKVALSCPGNLCYRLVAAHGVDFYLRTTVGERQTCADGVSADSFDTSIRIPKGGMVLLRFYPWSREGVSSNLFRVDDLQFEGVCFE